MTSIISSRFDEALRAQIVEQAKATLAISQAASHRRHRKRTFLLVFVPPTLGALAYLPADGSRPRPRVGFAQANVISAESQGVGGGVEDLLPPARASAPAPAREPDVQLMDVHEHAPAKVPPVPRRDLDTKPCASCGKPSPATPAAGERFDPATEDLLPEIDTGTTATPEPTSTPAALSVGTRFEAALDLAIQTGSVGTPVAATLAADVAGSDRVLLPAGSRVVGEAFATTTDDRVQVVLTAVVANGKTVKLSGIALGPDGVFGLPGKVVRKGSKAKAGAGRVLGAVGSALSFGLFRQRGGLVDAAAAELARDTGRSLAGIESAWQLSDKVIRVPAGTRLTVYVREDTTLPGSR